MSVGDATEFGRGGLFGGAERERWGQMEVGPNGGWVEDGVGMSVE